MTSRLDDLRRAVPGMGTRDHDPFGCSLEALERFAFAALVLRRALPVQASGLEALPVSGPVLLVANHAGPLPIGALALAAALLLEAPAPRLPRCELEPWSAALPWLGTSLRRLGHVVADPRNVAALLERGEVAVHVPPAARAGRGAPLGAFGREVLKVAARARATVIPTAIVGADRIVPTVRLDALGRLLGTRRPPFWPLGVPRLAPVRVALGTGRRIEEIAAPALDAVALELEEEVARLILADSPVPAGVAT